MDTPTPTPSKPDDRIFRVKFAGGPANGIMKDYQGEQSLVKYGGFEYEATGKRDGDHWLFARRHANRVARRVLPLLKASMGRDPRLEPKVQPNRIIKRGRNELCWCDSGRKYKKCHGSSQSS